jgi:hypothetical protein
MFDDIILLVPFFVVYGELFISSAMLVLSFLSGVLHVVNIFTRARSLMHGKRTWKVKITWVFGSIDFILR